MLERNFSISYYNEAKIAWRWWKKLKFIFHLNNFHAGGEKKLWWWSQFILRYGFRTSLKFFWKFVFLSDPSVFFLIKIFLSNNQNFSKKQLLKIYFLPPLDNDLYTGTDADFSGNDPIIYREPLQTDQFDSLSLNGELLNHNLWKWIDNNPLNLFFSLPIHSAQFRGIIYIGRLRVLLLPRDSCWVYQLRQSMLLISL